MKLTIKHQENFSRGQLLLRQLLGFIYIVLPHYFILLFVGIWQKILIFITWWVILFTGKYPLSFFEFQVGLIKWQVRLYARLMNLSDGYPAFGINATDDFSNFEMERPEKLSRGLLLVKTFFGGFYVVLPHVFILIFRYIGTYFLVFLAFWVVLFTGKYPKSWHDFVVGTLRWGIRLNLYYGLWMSDTYPPFTGKELESEKAVEQPKAEIEEKPSE